MCAVYELNGEDGTLTLAEYTRASAARDGTGAGASFDMLLGGDGSDDGGDGDDGRDAEDGDGGEPSDLLHPPRSFDQRRGLVGATCASGEQLLVHEPRVAEDFDEEVDNPLSLPHLRGMAIVPCFVSPGGAKEQPEGRAAVLVLFNKEPGAGTLGERSEQFSEADARMLKVYGRLVGSVQGQLMAMRVLQGQLHASSSALDVAITLTANLQGQNLAHNITSLARHLVPCEWATLYIFAESGGRPSSGNMRLVQVREDGRPGMHVRVGEGVPGSAAQTEQVVAMRSPETDPRFTEHYRLYGDAANRVVEILALPLLDAHGEVRGVLEMVNRLQRPSFRQTDEAELAPFCRLAGNALQNSKLLQVAQRTGSQTGEGASSARRRNSMMGVKRASLTNLSSPSPAAPAPSVRGEPPASAVDDAVTSSVDPLAFAEDASNTSSFAPSAASDEPMGLLSRRKLRASVF